MVKGGFSFKSKPYPHNLQLTTQRQKSFESHLSSTLMRVKLVEIFFLKRSFFLCIFLILATRYSAIYHLKTTKCNQQLQLTSNISAAFVSYSRTVRINSDKLTTKVKMYWRLTTHIWARGKNLLLHQQQVVIHPHSPLQNQTPSTFQWDRALSLGQKWSDSAGNLE